MTQPSQTIEWTMEAAYIAVLQDSAALVALLPGTASIHRDYDLTQSDTLPAVTVSSPGAKPHLARGDGWYMAPLEVTVITSLDDDLDGASRAALAGAVRDVFEDGGLVSDLQTAQDTLKVGRIEQPDEPSILDYPQSSKPTREWTYRYEVTCTMLDAIVNPEEPTP